MDIKKEWEEFDAWMKELGVSLFCPLCGNSDYDTDLVELPSKLLAPHPRHALAVICHECGFIRLFAQPPIDRLISDREEPSSYGRTPGW